MKSIYRINVVIAAIIAIVMFGCVTQDLFEPSATKPPAPTKAMVQSISATSVGMKWDAPTITTDVTGYVMMAVEVVAGGNGPQTEVRVGADTTMGVIGGLTEGKIYEFMVRSLNDTVRSDASNLVNWAPARRGIGTYKVYSALSTTNGSGLGIFSQTAAQLY